MSDMTAQENDRRKRFKNPSPLPETEQVKSRVKGKAPEASESARPASRATTKKATAKKASSSSKKK